MVSKKNVDKIEGKKKLKFFSQHVNFFMACHDKNVTYDSTIQKKTKKMKKNNYMMIQKKKPLIIYTKK
jgi:hypothetical protein